MARGDPIYNFYKELADNRVPLEAPVQTALATMVSNIYGNQNLQAPGGVQSLLIDIGPLASSFPQDLIPRTVGEVEQVLSQSFFPTMMPYAQQLENRSATFGDLMGEMTAASIEAAAVVQPIHLSKLWYIRRISNDSCGPPRNAQPGCAQPGPWVDTLGSKVEAGASAFDFVAPPSNNWYDQVAARVGENSVPLPFYAPKGTGLFSTGASGQLIINPQLTRSSRYMGFEQVSVTGSELSQYAGVMSRYYDLRAARRGFEADGNVEGVTQAETALNEMGLDPVRMAGVNKVLRQINNGLAGAETIGGNPIGTFAQIADAESFAMQQERYTWNAQMMNARAANYISGSLVPLGTVPAGANLNEGVGMYREFAGQVLGRQLESGTAERGARFTDSPMPELAYLGNRAPKNYSVLQRANREGEGWAIVQRDVMPGSTEADFGYYEAMQIFNTPAERMQVAAAREALATGRVHRNFVERWRAGQSQETVQLSNVNFAKAAKSVEQLTAYQERTATTLMNGPVSNAAITVDDTRCPGTRCSFFRRIQPTICTRRTSHACRLDHREAGSF